MQVSARRGASLSDHLYWNDSLEQLAAELQTPVELLKLSAEGLADELREQQGDPGEISAAETLIHSAEKMRRIVQVLLEVLHAEHP